MERWRHLTSRACGLIAAVFLVAMMLLTVADVVLRAAANTPLRGVYELVEVLLAGTFFVALPAVFLRDEHIVVNVIDDLAPRWVPALKRAAVVLAVIVVAVMAWQGFLAAAELAGLQRRDRRSRVAARLALDRGPHRPRCLRHRGSGHDLVEGREAMSVAAIGLLGVALLLVLILARVPIALALATAGLLGYAAIDGWAPALKMVGLVPYQLASSYSLSVVPLFILMGAIASRANMATELFQASNAVFSGIRGALANATIGACTLFGAICGSSIATAATFSKVAIPEMRRHGYEPAFAAGAVASAGTLGVLIPPSVLTAIYAVVAEQSLVKLYAAAMIPGLVLAALYVVVVLVMGRLMPAWIPKVPAMPLKVRLRAALGMWKLGVLFFLAVMGIYLGWFSPTEAAAVAAFAALLIAFATGAMGWRGFLEALLETAYTTAAIFYVVMGAFIFSRFIVLTQFPNELVRWVQEAGLSPAWILVAVMALYVLIGTFLDEVSTILITVPVTLPLILSIGYDGIWFGIFITVMCTIGLISPPTGMTVFVIQAQHPEIPVARIYLGTLPFLVADFVLVALLIAMPALVLWLPAFLKL